MEKIKLWKVTVNNWGWDAPKTLYFKNREDAAAAHDKYPAADNVEYAGMFSADHAEKLCGNVSQWD